VTASLFLVPRKLRTLTRKLGDIPYGPVKNFCSWLRVPERPGIPYEVKTFLPISTTISEPIRVTARLFLEQDGDWEIKTFCGRLTRTPVYQLYTGRVFRLKLLAPFQLLGCESRIRDNGKNRVAARLLICLHNRKVSNYELCGRCFRSGVTFL